MDALSFLRGALAEGNFYCLLALRDGGKEKENRRQVFFSSREKLVDAAAIWDARGWDTFFALGSFAEAGSRTAEEVQNVKAFFVDLDIGDDPKKYVNVSEAIAGLRKFCKQLGLPKPTIVNSGYGVHVYWMLKEYVTKHDWSCAATQFKKVMAENGLLADPAVTADCARVLRIPSTHNYKRDTPKEVTVVTQGDWVDFDSFVEKLGLDSIPVPTKVEQDATSAFLDALIRDRESSFKAILDKTAEGRGCKQLEIIVTDQENTSEPMWRAGLSIAKFCADGKKAAKLISRRHPEYDEESTADKFDRIKGPYLCSTFDSNYEGVCTDCPNWGKVKSPISLGAKFREATTNIVHEPAVSLPNAPITEYAIPTYPKPYFRGANGGIYVRSSNADGDVEEESIYHNDLYVVRRLHDETMGEVVVLRLHLPKDGVREFTIPLMAVTSKEEFRREMAKQGVAVTKIDRLMQYTTTFVNELQENTMADKAHTQFGWTDKTFTKFIIGAQEIGPNGHLSFNPPSSQTAGLFPAFEPMGSLQGWKDTMQFYDRAGMELHQYVIGTAFGSVLMPLLKSNIKCAALHIHSKESGLGKTTALYAAASVWGNPEDLVLQEQDTYASKMNRGELYKNLPLYIDELTNSHGKELSDLAYQLTSGKQRARMQGSVNQERARGLSWCLSAVTNGNTSAIERISMFKSIPKAEAQRILEANVKKMHFAEKSETDNFSASLTNNYGWAGVVFVQYVMDNVAEVSRLLQEMQVRIDKQTGLTAENRFWSIGAVTTIVALLIAKRLGLVSYDIRGVEQWINTVIMENKGKITDMSQSVDEILNSYIHENWGDFLRIKSTQDLRSEASNGNGLDEHVIPEMMPNRVIRGRIEPDTKNVFLLPKLLKEWCAEQQLNYSSFIEDLKKLKGAKATTARITKGTTVVLPPMRCLIVACGDDIESLNAAASS